MKERLGIKDKYPDFRNFRRKVLDVAKEEINEKTRLKVHLEFGRKGRKITQVHFEINEKLGGLLDMEGDTGVTASKSKQPRSKSSRGFLSRIDTLTEAQRRAFNHLSEYGVNLAVVLDEILPIIKGSELDGYEDFFVTYMLAFFEKKTNRTTSKDKIKAFVQWIRNRRFEEPGLYASLMEQVIARKKQLNDEERDNRERARKMTAQDFRKLLANEKNIGKHPLGEPTYSVKNKLSAKRRKSGVKRVQELFEEGRPTPNEFTLSHFRKQHPKIYRRILQERVEALADLKESSNFDQLLQSSVTAYCEQWWKQQRKG